MFGAIKKFFSKPEPPPAPQARPVPLSKSHSPVRPISPTPLMPSALPKAAPQPPANPFLVPTPPPPVQEPPAPLAPPPAPAMPGLVLPLHPILARLPSTLAAYARSESTDTISLPHKLIVNQLSTGAIRISFGDLRRSARPGVFSNNNSMDQVIVEIPLGEVLSRIDPALLARRKQTRTILPDGMPIVFGATRMPNQGLSVSAPVSATTESAPMPAPEPEPQQESIPSQVPERPKDPVLERAEMLRPAIKLTTPSTFQAVPLPALPPSEAPRPVLPKRQKAPVAPVATVVPHATSASTACLKIALSEINQAWPEAIKQEIQNCQSEGSSLNLPMDRLEPAMRSGRVVFPWGELLQWITPGITLQSAQRDVLLTLPLSVVAPLFLAQQQTARFQKKAAVGENIPDIFAGLMSATQAPQPSPAAPELPAAEAAPEPALKLRLVEEKTPEPPPTVPVALSPSEPIVPSGMPPLKMSQPEPEPAAEPKPAPASDTALFFSGPKTDWSPREVVRRTLGLNGVAGSLISMNDGLLVANKLPEVYKPETIAAFLPQIFGRMTQYTRELQLGPLTCVTLTVNNTPCAIYKSGSLYFMALGRAGEVLPEAKLQRIAAELAKHNP